MPAQYNKTCIKRGKLGSHWGLLSSNRALAILHLLFGYDDRFKFTSKERDSETGLDYFGARYYSSPVGIWLSVDPLADKYPGYTPYNYCLGNPIGNIDMHGDSVSFAILELYDKKYGHNATGNIINDLQSISGLTLSLSNGMLDYAKNEDGSAMVSGDGSSVSAREHLIALISNNQSIQVVYNQNKSFAAPDGIAISPKQIDCFINGARGVDSRTLGYGMTFLHESFHTNIGGGLKDDPSGTGPVVDKMNIIRSELNKSGCNFGQRITYTGIPSHGSNYIPFNNSAHEALNAGLLPSVFMGQFFIKY